MEGPVAHPTVEVSAGRQSFPPMIVEEEKQTQLRVARASACGRKGEGEASISASNSED